MRKTIILVILLLAAAMFVINGCAKNNPVRPKEADTPPLNSVNMCIELSVPFYSQNDQNWSGTYLGYNKCCWTIGNSGCHLVCIAMLYAKWGYPGMNPLSLNSWSYNGQAHYAFYPGGGDVNPYQAIQYPGICRNVRSISVNKDAIIAELAAGHPVIARVNWYGGHFVLIYGWDGTRFWVKDPVQNWQNQNQPLSLSSIVYCKVYGY